MQRFGGYTGAATSHPHAKLTARQTARDQQQRQRE
jgi:hypothetical protein